MKVAVIALVLLAVGSSAVHCPDGWFTLSANQTTQTAECYKLYLNKASPIDTEFFCSRVVMNDLFTVGHAASVRTTDDVALLVSLMSTMCELNVSNAASVGGVHMFGEYRWFDNTPFAISTPNVGDGCLTLTCAGEWEVSPCTDSKLPFFCRALVTAPVPTDPTTPMPTSATTAAPGSPTTAPPAPPRPPRPTAIANRTCPDSWTRSKVTGACYRFLPKLVEGLQADATCMASYPTARLVSVYDEDDSVAITNLLPTSTSALVMGVFMSGGDIGVVWEDYTWYTSEELAATSPSTPTWPTPANRFYQAWAPNEPHLDFGCVAIDRAGMWTAVSCRDPMPVVCSFMPNVATPSTTPTTVPPTSIITSAPGASCTAGWTYSASVGKCLKVVETAVRGRDMDKVCATTTPLTTPTASSLTTQDTAFLIASMIKSANDTEALVGLTFIGYGEDGYVTDGSTNWASVKAVVNGLWAPSEPTLEMGCVVVTPVGYTRAVACTAVVQAVVCQYDPSTLTTTTPSTLPTTIPTTKPSEGPLTVYSLAGRTHLEVTLNTIGTYMVGGSRNASGALLWFSHGGGCKGVPPPPYLSVVMSGGDVRIKHTIPTVNGTVCVSVDGSVFTPTNITFTVVDAIVDGIAYVGGDVTNPYLISRLSSTHFTLTGRNSSLIEGVRYSSVEGCNDPPFSFGPGFMKVNGSGAYGYDVIDYSRYHSRGYMVVPEYLTSFYVCVTLEVGGVFTLVPSLFVEVEEEEVIVTAADVGMGETTSIVLSQFDLPVLRIVGSGIKKGFFVGFSVDGACITDMDYSTAVPVTVNSDNVPIVLLNFNHTSVPTSAPLVMCIAKHPYLDPRPTRVRVTVLPTVVSGLSITPHQVGTPLTILTEGFQGLLYIWGLAGLSKATLSTMRVGFAPRTATNVATGICNASSFYGGRTFSPLMVGSEVGIALPRGFIMEGISVYHALCVSVGHGYPSARLFHLTSVLIDVRPLTVLRVGASPLVSSAIPYPTLVLCDQLLNLVLPIQGYGLQGGMSALLSPNPCITPDVAGVDVPLRADYTDPLKGHLPDATVYLGLNATSVGAWRSQYGSSTAWLCIRDPVLGAKFTPFRFQFAPPKVHNISSTTIVYGEPASIQVSGFGLDAGPTVSIGVSGNCNTTSTYILKPAPLTKSPPSNVADFEFISSPLTSLQGMFASYTSLQTASLTVTHNITAMYCMCIGGVCSSTGIPVIRRVPSIDGFLVLSTIKKQVYIDSDEDTEPQPYQLEGPLVDANPHTLVVHFVNIAANCGNMTDTDSPFATKATLGSVLVFPGSVPVGEYHVCFTTRTTTPLRYAALDFGLTAILKPATTSLFSINGTTRLTLHPGVERLLPVDGSGIRQSSVLRLAPPGAGCVSSLPDLPLHRVDGVWYVFFTELHTSADVGNQAVCLKGNNAGLWEELRIQVNVEPTREALWFSYFSAQSVVTVEPQFPAVFQRSAGASTLYTVASTDLVGKLKCAGGSCPLTSRLIFVKVDSSNKDAPCAFSQNAELPSEIVAGPFTTFNSIFVLPVQKAKDWSSVIGYRSNWTMCVEGGPSFWIRPASPISLSFAPLTVWSVTIGAHETTHAEVEAGSEAARIVVNGLGIEEGTTARFGKGCRTTLEDDQDQDSYIAANSQLVNTTFTLFGAGMIIDGTLLEKSEIEPIPMCVAAPNSKTYTMTNITLMIVGPKDPSIPEDLPEPLLSVPVNSTGTVYLSQYGISNIPIGSAVMLSTACYFNSHGLPIMTVVGNGAIHLQSAHTAIPTTASLEICLRRMASGGQYATSFYKAIGVRFGVINVTVSVADAVTVVRNVHESLILSMQVSGDGGLVPAQLLPYFDSLRLSIHAPCGEAHLFPPLFTQRLADQTISKRDGVVSGSSAGTVVAVVEGSSYTVSAPASVCVSVDGGRQYFTTNVAYLEVDWNSTLLIEGLTRVAKITSQSLEVYGFADSRLGTSPLAVAAQATLWKGCVSDQGVVLTESTLLIPSLLSVGTFELVVSCGKHIPIKTGINVIVSELSFLCSGLIAVGPSDVGRLVSEDICVPTSTSITTARYAETCAGSSWAGVGSVVNGTVVVPLAIAFADSSLKVCPKVYCSGDCAETGAEARYVSSELEAQLVDYTTTIEINGIANGIVLLHYGISHIVTVTTGGMDEANMLLSFLPKGSDDCGDARPEDVVDVAEGFAHVSKSLLVEVANSEADARRVCYSYDGGANYLPVGTIGLWVIVAPVRVVGLLGKDNTLLEEGVVSKKGVVPRVYNNPPFPARALLNLEDMSVRWSGEVQTPKSLVAVPSTTGCTGAARSYTFEGSVNGSLTLKSGSYPTVVPTAPFILCTLNNGAYYGPEWGAFLAGKQLSTPPHLTAATIRFDSTVGNTRPDDTTLVVDSASAPSSSEDVRLWVASTLSISPSFVQVVIQKGPSYTSNITITRIGIKVDPTPTLLPQAAYTTLVSLIKGVLPLALRSTVRYSSGGVVEGSSADTLVLGVVDTTAAEKTGESSWGWASVPVLLLLPAFLLLITARFYYMYFDIGTIERLEGERADEEAAAEMRGQELQSETN